MEIHQLKTALAIAAFCLFHYITNGNSLTRNQNPQITARFTFEGHYRIPFRQVDRRHNVTDISSCLVYCLRWQCCSYAEFRTMPNPNEGTNCKVSAQDIAWNATWRARQGSMIYARMDTFDCV